MFTQHPQFQVFFQSFIDLIDTGFNGFYQPSPANHSRNLIQFDLCFTQFIQNDFLSVVILLGDFLKGFQILSGMDNGFQEPGFFIPENPDLG